MYRWRSIVKFYLDGDIKEGLIEVVHDNGSEEPLYDISYQGRLYQNIPQSKIVEYVCMAYERSSDEELRLHYIDITGVINECGMHEKSLQAYMDCTKEIAKRYFEKCRN